MKTFNHYFHHVTLIAAWGILLLLPQVSAASVTFEIYGRNGVSQSDLGVNPGYENDYQASGTTASVLSSGTTSYGTSINTSAQQSPICNMYLGGEDPLSFLLVVVTINRGSSATLHIENPYYSSGCSGFVKATAYARIPVTTSYRATVQNQYQGVFFNGTSGNYYTQKRVKVWGGSNTQIPVPDLSASTNFTSGQNTRVYGGGTANFAIALNAIYTLSNQRLA